MKNYSTMSDVGRRVKALYANLDCQQAFIDVADTFDNAHLIANHCFGDKFTCADVIRLTELMLAQEQMIVNGKKNDLNNI